MVAAITVTATWASGTAKPQRRIGIARWGLRNALSNIRERRFGALYLYYMVGNALSRTMAMVFLVPMLEASGIGVVLASYRFPRLGWGAC